MEKYERLKTLTIPMIIVYFYACGSDTGTGPQNPATLSRATFTSIQQKLFMPTCAISGCHNGRERPTLSAGAAYNNIVNVLSSRGVDYIEPGDPNNSYLYRKITGVNIQGALMPRSGSALSQAVKDSVRVWIENGALNN